MTTNNRANLWPSIIKRMGVKRMGSATLAIAAVILPACASSTPEANVETETSEMTEAMENNVTAEDLSEDLASYLGQTVTIREEVEEVVTDYAFLLEEDQFFGGKETLIINASGQTVDLVDGEDTDVQVTGEVRAFVLADLEREYGFDLDDDLFIDYDQQPVIIAESIALSPDPDDISDSPEDYYFRRIAVEGDVETLLGPNVATLNEEALFGGEDLLVIHPEENFLVKEGESVVMTGTLQAFVTADIERDYDLTWDLDLQEQIEVEYENRPVLIVDSVYPSAM